MLDWLPVLQGWLSPSYPTGGFSYSHGLEWAVETGRVRNVAGLVEYVGCLLEQGGGWGDLVLMAASWRAVAAGDDADLAAIIALSAALPGTAEMALETLAQGQAFATITRAAWPGTALDRVSDGLTYPVAIGIAASGLVPLSALLVAYAHALAANFVSAGIRLVPLGQTDGQRALALLLPVIRQVAAAAEAADHRDFGMAAPMIDLCSMHHETQYSRLFRS